MVNKTMDRLDRMQLFIRIVERRSFAAAASDLGLARSTATERSSSWKTMLAFGLSSD